jgi:hypothetical protein
VCEFEQSSYFEAMKEIIDANKASDELKLQYAKGENWQCENDATVRVQGETDSFGCEYSHYCEACHKLSEELNDHYTKKHEDDESQCEWCKKVVPQKNLRYTRDIDEGSNGPVYEVCGSCRARQAEQIAEELASYDD